MWHAGLNEAQARIKIARRNTNNLRYTYDTFIAKSKEEVKILLIRENERKRRVKKLT